MTKVNFVLRPAGKSYGFMWYQADTPEEAIKEYCERYGEEYTRDGILVYPVGDPDKYWIKQETKIERE